MAINTDWAGVIFPPPNRGGRAFQFPPLTPQIRGG